MTNNIAIIDTETNWDNEVMTLGLVIANQNLEIISQTYFIFTPQISRCGKYIEKVSLRKSDFKNNRQNCMNKVNEILKENEVDSIFAYNGVFDKEHLTELKDYNWYDIMKVAAYKQYNPRLPQDAEFCKTGRLKKGYGVEDIYRMLSGNDKYEETHNAIIDAYDEVMVMRFIGLQPVAYSVAKL